MNLAKRSSLCFFPFPEDAHQLTLLPEYLDDPSIVVDCSPWVECSQRVHGMFQRRAVLHVP